MRIVIDLQGAQTSSRFRGIGRYSLSLAQAIVRNRGKHEILLALNGLFPNTIEPIRAVFDGLLPQENIKVWYAPGPVCGHEPGNEWRREVAERLREAFLASLQPDIVHVTSLFEGYVDDGVSSIGLVDPNIPTCITFYDLIPLLNPEYYLHSNPDYEQYYLRKIDYIKRAHMLLAISECSRQEGIRFLGIPDDLTLNISSAADAHFRPLSLSEERIQALRDRFGLARPFVFYTGLTDERKNLPRLIRAYAKLSPGLRKTHQLVITGKDTGGHEELKNVARSAGLCKEELIFTGYVTEDELVALYNLCKLYVFPSWHEGFGLPALEAMQCGAPVIAANTSSLPEVIGRNDALFDPFDEQSITEKIRQTITDGAFRRDLKRHGIEQSRNFSWDISAKTAISIFDKVHKKFTQEGPFVIGTKSLIQEISGITNFCHSDHDLLKTAFAIAKNYPNKQEKNIFIDISELIHRDARTGVQRVTRAILKELLRNPPLGYVVHPVYATIDRFGYFYAKNSSQNPCKIEGELIDYNNGDIFFGLDLQHHTTRVQAEFLAGLRRDGVRIYFVVYDLLPINFPQYWPKEHSAGQVHHDWLKAIMHYDGAICISRAVADELAGWIKDNGPERVRSFKIGWFHLGADIGNSTPSRGLSDNAEELLKIIHSRASFLMVGTIEPRKGHTQTLTAFEQLWREGVDVNLIIVGKQGWMVDLLIDKLQGHPEFGERLLWLEGISDEYLEKVYAASTCLIAASEGEGFGLPLIEAAQHQLPIIARDIPVFREVAGQRAYYFSGKQPADLSTTVKRWLGLYQENQHPQSVSMPWLTWKQSASRLKEIILNDDWLYQIGPDGQVSTREEVTSFYEENSL